MKVENFIKGSKVEYIPIAAKFTVLETSSKDNTIRIQGEEVGDQPVWVHASMIRATDGEPLAIGREYYHIDEPNQPFVIVTKRGSCTYALLQHPSFHASKLIDIGDIGKTFFAKREDCLAARIKRIKKELAVEKSCQKRKI